MKNKVLNDHLTEVIFTLSRLMKEEMTFDSDTSQLTVIQLQTLIFIKKNDVITMSDLANKFKITLPSTTVLSDKLVKLSLIERIRNEDDRRIVQLSLTKKGANLLKEAMRQRHQKISKMLSYLSVEDKVQLFRILKNLSDNIQKAYEK